MKTGRKMIAYVICAVIGVALFGLGCAEVVDSFWCGMGSGLMVVSIWRLIQWYRFKNSDTYRKKIEIETSDERNRFIRATAWAWAGYLFILIASASVIALKVMGEELLSLAASCAVCLLLALYWIAYFLLRKKY